ncbi:hypothetical protein HanPI659440_Chr01g0027831 [Helianthus annuus]|nr:hypothetical protein HanPI659440_Chr01g0027831 [Helianthus annuus]
MGVYSVRGFLVLFVVLLAFVGDLVLGDSVEGVKDEKNLFGKPKLGFKKGLGHGIYKKGFKHLGKGGGGGLGGGGIGGVNIGGSHR